MRICEITKFYCVYWGGGGGGGGGGSWEGMNSYVKQAAMSRLQHDGGSNILDGQRPRNQIGQRFVRSQFNAKQGRRAVHGLSQSQGEIVGKFLSTMLINRNSGSTTH